MVGLDEGLPGTPGLTVLTTVEGIDTVFDEVRSFHRMVDVHHVHLSSSSAEILVFRRLILAERRQKIGLERGFVFSLVLVSLPQGSQVLILLRPIDLLEPSKPQWQLLSRKP
jgi:hypothetical protein